MKKSLITFSVTIGVLVIAFLVYLFVTHQTSPCESIFQQTSLRLGSKLDMIKSKGEVLIGEEKIQDLSERSQGIALNLKTCCILLDLDKISSEQFLVCKDSVEKYERQIEKVATNINEAQVANQEGKTELVNEKVSQINQTLNVAKAKSEELRKQVTELKVTQSIEKTGEVKQPATQVQPLIKPEAINLLAAENGGQLLVVPNDTWLGTIDGKEDLIGFANAGEEAVFAFKDEQPATFDTFSLLIPGTGDNVKEFELLVGNDSPIGQFHSIGKFQTKNVKLVKTPYQEFKFPAVTAKYLKVKLLSGYTSYLGLHEFRLLGTLQGETKQ